jgi:hypothetical protein
MILIDYSALAFATVLVNPDMANNEDMIRHMILNQIRMYRSKFKAEYGEIVICCDGPNNWRYGFFKEYKANRKTDRTESTIDWNLVFKIVNETRDDLENHFPYKTVKVDGCEGDDVIGALVDLTQEFGKHEKIMIISSDKDFKQLHKYSNVSQFSLRTKKIMQVDDPYGFLFEMLLKGDSGDGVPNVRSADDFLVKKESRAKPISAKMIEKMRASDDLEADLGPEQYKNYKRNQMMIDLSYTPANLKQECINTFVNQDKTGYGKKVMPYLMKNRMKMLLERVQEFVN